MNKEDILERSREENRNGDEFEKAKKETALMTCTQFPRHI